ncbi:hypothetical protein GCM10022406_25640 [Hymenobacter algoricola]|uniref:Uncharacterized protein n=1 Tax=Hymenobacter algoricola TaxID=486267 RepID=A0ABP7N9D5_9BACT
MTAIAKQDCAVNLKQLQRLLLQRYNKVPTFATEAEMKTLAAWEALFDANDDTKVIITPFFQKAVIPSSEAQFGGENSNDTLNGVGTFLGFNPVRLSGEFVGLDSATYEQLDALTAESLAELGVARVTAYPVTADGEILAKGLRGIPGFNFTVGSPGTQGFKSQTVFPFGMSFSADWFKGVSVIKPTFNPLTDLDA